VSVRILQHLTLYILNPGHRCTKAIVYHARTSITQPFTLELHEIKHNYSEALHMHNTHLNEQNSKEATLKQRIVSKKL